MDAFRSIAIRVGEIIMPVAILLFIVGFHGQPALWIPLVLVFVAAWIMGVRSDRRRMKARRRR